MANLFLVSPGLGKVYRYDGSSWTLFADAPNSYVFSGCDAGLFVHQGKLFSFHSRANSSVMDLFRLNSNGTWTTMQLGVSRVGYAYAMGYARYRGRVFIPMIAANTEARVHEWDGSGIVNTVTVTGVYEDGDANTVVFRKVSAGRIEAWRERLLLGPAGHGILWMRGNYLFAIDPTIGGNFNKQQLLGGPDGDHALAQFYGYLSTHLRRTLSESIHRSPIAYGTYAGKIYLLGCDGGVRELKDNGSVTATPIFSFKSAFPVLGPYTAHANNPDSAGLLVAKTSGGLLDFRNLLVGAEITCDGRVGIVNQWGSGTDPSYLYLRDPTTDLIMGNFPSGASYTVKQGLGWCANVSSSGNFGDNVRGFFVEYNNCLYVLICGTQALSVTPGSTCPSILAKWDGVSVTFTEIKTAGNWLSAAGSNVQVDPSNGYLHLVYWTYLTATSVTWRHVAIALNGGTPAVVIDQAIVGESGWTSTHPALGANSMMLALFTHNRPTAEVTATAYDAVRNVMTVTYSLYDDDSSDIANIRVETDFGTGWFEATRKGAEGEGKINLSSSPSGVSHTFVHDLGADGSPLINRIQYRITAAQASA